MGQKDKTKSSIPETTQILDFLYIDKERADSFISQLRNGTLRSVTKTTGTSESSSISMKGNAAVVNGEYKHDQKTDANAAEQYDPYHNQLINLLNDLNIQPLDNLPVDAEGQLVLLLGTIAIRDAETMRSLLHVLSKNKNMLGSQFDRNTRSIIKMITDTLDQLPDTISFSMKFQNTMITGVLKESALAIQKSDLMRIYGAHMPGKWYVLGIIDHIAANDELPTTPGSIEDAIDICSNATNQLFASSEYKIIPILVFRPISII